jgi:hypothetical protein
LKRRIRSSLSGGVVRGHCPRAATNWLTEKKIIKNKDLTDVQVWHAVCFIVFGNNKQPAETTTMNTRISSKLAVLAVALLLNAAIVGGVAYFFDVRIQQDWTTSACGTVTVREVV